MSSLRCPVSLGNQSNVNPITLRIINQSILTFRKKNLDRLRTPVKHEQNPPRWWVLLCLGDTQRRHIFEIRNLFLIHSLFGCVDDTARIEVFTQPDCPHSPSTTAEIPCNQKTLVPPTSRMPMSGCADACDRVHAPPHSQ